MGLFIYYQENKYLSYSKYIHMKKTLHFLLFSLSIQFSLAQFPNTSETWNIPNVESNGMDMNYVSGSTHTLFDINGDGLVDLIDVKDNFTGEVWQNGAQRYWKVYLNDGNSISSVATNWDIPNVESNAADMSVISSGFYSLFDINGDGFPDLIDAKDNFTGDVWVNGAQRYWKVYFNNGTAISTTATNWNVPNVESNESDMNVVNNTFYGLYDMDGDGDLDLVDSRDNFTQEVWVNGVQRYWKVYVNNGSQFSTVASNWNVPNLESDASSMAGIQGAYYSLIDIDGDGKPNLVDSRDNFTEEIHTNQSQRYWQVYEQNSTGFNTIPTQWNLPNVESSAAEMTAFIGQHYALIDLNGDNKLDLVDSRDNFTQEIWVSGVQRYWKVYLNDGTAFNTNALTWNLPNVESSAVNMTPIHSPFYALYDMNGDNALDLVDSRDNLSGSIWENGAQRYWKVYLNPNDPNVGIGLVQNQAISVYPNPSNDQFFLSELEFVNAELLIYNELGQVVFMQSNVNAKNHKIDLSSLQNGVYFLEIRSEQQVYTAKLLKK